MNIDLHSNIWWWVNLEVEMHSIAQRVGRLHIEAGVWLQSLATFRLLHRRRAKGQDVEAQSESDDANQTLDELSILFMFGREGHNLQGSIIIADAQPTGFAHLFEQFFVVFPTDSVKSHYRVSRQLSDDIIITGGLCNHNQQPGSADLHDSIIADISRSDNGPFFIALEKNIFQFESESALKIVLYRFWFEIEPL